MTRIAILAIGGGCLVAVLAGVGPSGRRVAGAEPASGQQPAPGDLPPELQAVRESLGGSAVEHFPSLRPQADELSPWKSLSWAGAGVIRSVLISCGLPCHAAAEPTAVSEPAALPPVIAPAAPPMPSPYVPAAWPSTPHAALPIPTGWSPQAAAATPAAPTPAPAYAAPLPPSTAPIPEVSPYTPGPAAPKDTETTPLAVLRSTARQLDVTANQLEELSLYEQADALREVAQKLRVDARSLATPTLVPVPSEGQAVDSNDSDPASRPY